MGQQLETQHGTEVQEVRQHGRLERVRTLVTALTVRMAEPGLLVIHVPRHGFHARHALFCHLGDFAGLGIARTGVACHRGIREQQGKHRQQDGHEAEVAGHGGCAGSASSVAPEAPPRRSATVLRSPTALPDNRGMLAIELNTRDIPDVYARFAREIGDRNWKARVHALKQEIRGNPFLEHLHIQENAIAYQLERLRELQERYAGVAVQAYNDHFHYPAASFAAQVLSIIDRSDATMAERFRGRVRGALNNPAEMRALRLELMAATHFLRAGRRVSWPEMAAGALPGQRIFDLLVEDLGPTGLEIECKSFSEEKGRRIGRRAALEFFWLVRSRHWTRLRQLQPALAVVVTLPRELPTQYKRRVALADAVAALVMRQALGSQHAAEACVRIAEIQPHQLDAMRAGGGATHLRSAFDAITGTRNKEVVAMGTPSGGSLVMGLQSAEDDTLMDGILRTMKNSATNQFSATRAAMMIGGFDGLTAEQLLDLAKHDQDPDAVPTALRLCASTFLGSPGRDHVIGLTFLSRSSLRPAVAGALDSGGTAYTFPKRGSPFWSDEFSGLFGHRGETVELA